MPNVGRSRFVNRVALRKAIRGISTHTLRGAFIPHYNNWADRIRRTAKSNAPVKSGKLRGNILKSSRIKNSARRGGKKGSRLGTFYIHSRSIQDRVTHFGIPNRRMAGKDLTKRSRKWNGVKHRPKPAGNFARGGGQSRANKYNGKDWAFGVRHPNPYLNKGKNQHTPLVREQKKVASAIGKDIVKWVAREFAKNVGKSKR